jgi:putative Mn2+ efflux pump MntP
MGLIAWYNEKIKKLNVWDIGALKTYVFLFGLIIGAYFPGFVKQYLWVIIILIILLVIKLIYKVFKK